MKQRIFGIAITLLVFAACNSNSKTNTSGVDTANRTLQDRSTLMELNGIGDTIIGADGNRYVKVNPNTAPAAAPPIVVQPTPGTTTTITTRSNTSRSVSSSGSGRSYSSSSGSGTAQTQTKKKGWSKAAKGAVIGGATGAVAGAIVSKKKGTGAVVGGLIGAGAGYIIGRSKDKKDGRVP